MLGRWELSKHTPCSTTPISCVLLLPNGFPQLLFHVCVILVVFGLRLFGGKLAKIHRNTCNKIPLEEGAIPELLNQMRNLQQNKQQTSMETCYKMDVSKQSANGVVTCDACTSCVPLVFQLCSISGVGVPLVFQLSSNSSFVPLVFQLEAPGK